MKEEIKVSKTKDDMGKDEWWCNWYRCNNCTKSYIGPGFKFCPNCGLKIKWIK